MTFRAIFSRKWIIPSILIVLGMIGLVRLGFWQLDRLHQKQTYNALMAERWRATPFDLNNQSFPATLADLEYRRVAAQGDFDYARQILVSTSGGYAVVTPLVLDNNRAVLVLRGWLPADQVGPEQITQYQETPGAPLMGIARQSQSLPNGAVSTPVQTPQVEWYRIDIPAIQGQMPYQLESAYLEQLPEEGRSASAMPLRSNPTPLDEGNHLSYAIQWFTFALVLGFGYIMLVRYQTRKEAGLIIPVPLAPDVASVLPSSPDVRPVDDAGTASHTDSVVVAASEPEIVHGHEDAVDPASGQQLEAIRPGDKAH